MRFLPVPIAILALAACARPEQPVENEPEATAEAGPVKGVDRSHKGKPFPAVMIGDPDGTETSYEGFRGIPTLINFWASWCAPCIKELPTLKKLADRKGADLWVVPISQDNAPLLSIETFLNKTGAGDLGAYHDPNMKVSGALGVQVLPTTILFDAEGREVWRYVGDLDWTGEEAARLLAEASPGKP